MKNSGACGKGGYLKSPPDFLDIPDLNNRMIIRIDHDRIMVVCAAVRILVEEVNVTVNKVAGFEAPAEPEE